MPVKRCISSIQFWLKEMWLLRISLTSFYRAFVCCGCLWDYCLQIMSENIWLPEDEMGEDKSTGKILYCSAFFASRVPPYYPVILLYRFIAEYRLSPWPSYVYNKCSEQYLSDLMDSLE